MTIKLKYTPSEGFTQSQGTVTGSTPAFKLELPDNQEILSLDITRSSVLRTSPATGISEVSGSLLMLKGREEGIYFHLGGHQYISNNAFFDANHLESAAGRWVYETDSAAFRWGFIATQGQFDLDWAQTGTANEVITGSSNAVWGPGLSMTASNGAIGLGKQAKNGLNATLDITGSNHLALAVTGSVEVGGGAPEAFFMLPNHNNTSRNAIPTPRTGMMIYNTGTNKINFYNGTAWRSLDDSAV